MNITKEELKSLYERVIQVAIAKFPNHSKPDSFRIYEDGTIVVIYDVYRWGEWTEERHNIPFEILTQDLDAIIAERKRQEEIDKKHLEEQRILLEKREKELRRAKFLELKKEFESES